ncbi:DNA-directed RNA polymerase sigma-70 factor [Haloferula helveola]|uniref:DNA-directed RNA polymerase sigma-70 factor n=1 Tax=Haloferula helveola TaxID=490095 RepID=A0ABN6H533_9BACT|nr:DNA-directed RNA polymerase sigma-70 factor [Haloferula helveola]
MTQPTPDDSSQEFLELMLKSQRPLRNYLFSLHPRAQDLDDLMQETARTLWKEFHRYDREREFLPWAMRIGYFEVLRLRKKHSRDRLVFSDELFELLADEPVTETDADRARGALEHCLADLTPRAKEVLMARYTGGESVSDLATRQKSSVHSLYRLLEKSRTTLVTCVRRHLYLDTPPA